MSVQFFLFQTIDFIEIDIQTNGVKIRSALERIKEIYAVFNIGINYLNETALCEEAKQKSEEIMFLFDQQTEMLGLYAHLCAYVADPDILFGNDIARKTILLNQALVFLQNSERYELCSGIKKELEILYENS